MLSVSQLSKSYGIETIFEDVTFSLGPGERVGLVGPNGCGKTTLLRILTGGEKADAGVYTCDPPGLRIGYLPQNLELRPQETVAGFLSAGEGLAALSARLEELAARLAQAPREPALLGEYDDVLTRLQAAAPEEARRPAVLAGLGLGDLADETLLSTLSGGQLRRLALAGVLISSPQLLLLDEPTNHLDLGMLEWLEDWLAASPCAALIVSHDRVFLDRVVRRILALDPHSRRLRQYAGGYSDYEAQRQTEFEKQWEEYNDQVAETRRMKQDIARLKEQAAFTERQASSARIGGPDMKITGFKTFQKVAAKKVARKAKSRQKKLERYLDSEERVERPLPPRQVRMEFVQTPHLGRLVIQLTDLSIGYHPGQALLSCRSLEVHAGQRVVISGPNGCGKTTLLRTIAGTLPPLAGEVRLGETVRLGYMSQDQSGIEAQLTALETVLHAFHNETEARYFLARFLLLADEPLKPVAQLSYGQRARLALARMIADGCNCLLLDEPVNHLDIPSRAQFEQALDGFQGTVLAVVHDRYFIERFAEEVWKVEGRTIQKQ